MKTPIKKALSILNRELKLAKSVESKAILSEIILEVESNLIKAENDIMATMFDYGFSHGCDYALNDKGNISGKEWLLQKESSKVILCEICDSEVIPDCEYKDCPNN